MNNSATIKTIILLSDGVLSNDEQSRGVAIWISKLTGAEILEARIPELSGVTKLKVTRSSRILTTGSRGDARDWLAMASADILVRKVGQWFAERNYYEGTRELLIVSTGNDCSPYNLALAYIWRCACATITTPKIFGTEPFDFAIIPEYEFPSRKTNTFITVGPPNTLEKDKFRKEATKMAKDYILPAGKKWTVIIGGNDRNYLIKPEWIKRNLGVLMRIAEIEKTSLYIWLLGNISKDADETFKQLISRATSVEGYYTNMSKDAIPLPVLLTVSDEIFCTENILNAILETITVGNKVVLMRMDWKRGIRSLVKRTISSLVSVGALKQELLIGSLRYEVLFDYLIRHNYMTEFKDWRRRRHIKCSADEEPKLEEFNESKRAASWIVSSWESLFYR